MELTEKQKIKEIDAEIATLNNKLKKVEGRNTEVYTRIVGYHRAINSWNKGKKEEYKFRKTFNKEQKEEWIERDKEKIDKALEWASKSDFKESNLDELIEKVKNIEDKVVNDEIPSCYSKKQ